MKNPKFLLLASCLTLLSIASIHAQTSTWSSTPANNTFSNPNNWVGSIAPNSGDALVFSSSTNSGPNITTNFSANGLTFNGAYPHYFISSTNGSMLSIGAGGITLNATTASVTTSSNVDFNGSLQIALTASQSWTTNGTTSANLTVSNNISGNNTLTLTKAGTGYLALNGNNSSLNSNITVSAGTLYLGQTSSAGNGTLSVRSAGTVGAVNSDITINNAVNLASGATLGGSLNGGGGHMELSNTVTVPSGASTLTVAGSEVVFTGILTAAGAGSNLTVHGAGTAIAVLANATSNITTMIADNAGIGFGNTATLPATSVQASNGGYVSVAAVGGSTTTPSVTTLLGLINNSSGGNPGFNGIIGFDTSDNIAAPHVFSEDINLTGFTAGHVSLSSSTSAVISGNITLPSGATSYDFKGFGNQGGILVVTSNLTNNGGTTGITVTSPNSGGVGNGGMGVILQGTNTFSGTLSVTNSAAILDSASALPSKQFSMGANSYVGTTENAGYSNFSMFASNVTSYTSTSILGLDSHTALNDEITNGTISGPSSIRTVTDNIDLSGKSAIFLGTALGVTIGSESTIKAPNDGVLRLVNLGGDTGNFTIAAPLLTSGSVTSLVVGMPGADGAVVLNNSSNNYSGGTTLQGGKLLAGDNNALGTGSITVSSTSAFGSGGDAATIGAALDGTTLNNNIAVTNFLAVGTGKYDDSGNFTAGTTNLTLSGTISSVNPGTPVTGRLYITGPTVINGSNTYTAGTYVLANTTVNTDTGLGSFFVDIGYDAVLTFTSTHPVIGGGSLADASQFLGNNAGSGTIKLDTGVSTLTINQTSTSTFSGQITGTDGPSGAALTKNGTGQLSLVGDNAGQWTGGTTINAGTLAIGNGSATTATFGGNVFLAGGSLAFQPGNSQNMTFSGNITTSSGTGSVTINGNSGGTVSITTPIPSTSTFNGTTTISTGTLHITADDLWSASSNTFVGNGAKLQLDGNQTITNLSGSGNIVLSSNSTKTLTVNSTSGTTVSGVISGSGGLTKTGTFAFTLSGANTYAGPTTVSGGTLFVNGSLANSATTVATGTTLGGFGTLAAGATIQSGGHLAPGGSGSAGTITFTSGGLTLLAGAILDFQLGASSDKVFVTGGGTLTGPSSGTMTLNISNSGGFVAGTYTLFDFSGGSNSGLDPSDFVFGGLPAGNSSNYSLAIVGSQLQLTSTVSAVPEPSTFAAIAGALGLGLAVWRRRRAAERTS